jgi:hypothetical protein
MNMASMNPAAGGPVGGGMIMMMNNGNPPPQSSSSSHSDLKRRLDTYIYDYFLKNGHHEHARALYRDESIKLNTHPHTKPSPNRRRDGEMNGIDENAMDTDSKDDINKIPDDLPKPDVPDNAQSGFLYDWFGMFIDIYGASRNKKPDGDSSTASQYLQQTQVRVRFGGFVNFIADEPPDDATIARATTQHRSRTARNDAKSPIWTAEYAQRFSTRHAACDGGKQDVGQS